jgi:hypothetical protein
MTRALWLALALPAAVGAEEAPRSGQPGTVTMPLPEYQALLDRAARPPKRPERPPLPAAIGRADIALRVEADVVRGRYVLEGEVFRAGTTKVPLLSGATLVDAKLGAQPLALLHEAGVHAALLAGPGPFSISLEWGAPVAAEPGRASFALPVPEAGSVRASLDVPGELAELRVEPGLVTRRAARAGRARFELTLEPGRPARVAWSSREAPAAPREARFLSDVKTLVSVGESELRLAALVDLSVIQGRPQAFELRLPEGFEATSVSGPGLDRTEEEGGGLLRLVVRAAGRHQVLVALEKAGSGGSFEAEAALPMVLGAQRETGEVAIEGVGPMELLAREGEGMRRMDVREVAAELRSLARQPVLAAFRYQRRGEAAPRVGLQASRFPEAQVLAAVAERATVTTLATRQGRTLTEIALTVRNQAQAFLKLDLPEGATLLSAEVEGESVKPVKAADGTRVPLLRPGFRPEGPYRVAFVYLHAGAPLARKGEAALTLPRLDVPVTLLEWELFLPDQYRVRGFGGDVLPWAGPSPTSLYGRLGAVAGGVAGAVLPGLPRPAAEYDRLAVPGPGVIVGRVTEESGAPLPGATVTAETPLGTRVAVAGADGSYALTGLPPGKARLQAELTGFTTARRAASVGTAGGTRADLQLEVGSVQETVTVAAEGPDVEDKRDAKRADEPVAQAPSANVLKLQQRVAGVLPVRFDVPRAGASYHLARPLVLDEATTVRFRYKTK